MESEILPYVRLIEFDEPAALLAGDQRASRKRTGQLIAAEDLQIGACAMSRGFTIVTRNTRHFEKISGLRIENWFA